MLMKSRKLVRLLFSLSLLCFMCIGSSCLNRHSGFQDQPLNREMAFKTYFGKIPGKPLLKPAVSAVAWASDESYMAYKWKAQDAVFYGIWLYDPKTKLKTLLTTHDLLAPLVTVPITDKTKTVGKADNNKKVKIGQRSKKFPSVGHYCWRNPKEIIFSFSKKYYLINVLTKKLQLIYEGKVPLSIFYCSPNFTFLLLSALPTVFVLSVIGTVTSGANKSCVVSNVFNFVFGS